MSPNLAAGSNLVGAMWHSAMLPMHERVQWLRASIERISPVLIIESCSLTTLESG